MPSSGAFPARSRCGLTTTPSGNSATRKSSAAVTAGISCGFLKTLRLHQRKLRDSGRKFHASDERFLKEAERVLYGEFAHVLHLEPAQVEPMILREIQQVESGS